MVVQLAFVMSQEQLNLLRERKRLEPTTQQLPSSKIDQLELLITTIMTSGSHRDPSRWHMRPTINFLAPQ
jgi:hypothetical protein